MILPNNMEPTIKDHRHNGIGDQRINLTDIVGMFPTVSVAPTHIPRNLYEQLVIYINGATYKLYLYDATNKNWKSVTLA